MPLEFEFEIRKPIEELFDLFADHRSYIDLAYRSGVGMLNPKRVRRKDEGPLRAGSTWSIRAGLLGWTRVTSRLTEYSRPALFVRRQEGGVTSEIRFSFASLDASTTRITVRLLAHTQSSIQSDADYLRQNRQALFEIKNYLETS